MDNDKVFIVIQESSVLICTPGLPWRRVTNARDSKALRAACALLNRLPSDVYCITQAEYDAIVEGRG